MGTQVEKNQLWGGGLICGIDLKKNKRWNFKFEGVGGFTNMGGFVRDYGNYLYLDTTLIFFLSSRSWLVFSCIKPLDVAHSNYYSTACKPVYKINTCIYCMYVNQWRDEIRNTNWDLNLCSSHQCLKMSCLWLEKWAGVDASYQTEHIFGDISRIME